MRGMVLLEKMELAAPEFIEAAEKAGCSDREISCERNKMSEASFQNRRSSSFDGMIYSGSRTAEVYRRNKWKRFWGGIIRSSRKAENGDMNVLAEKKSARAGKKIRRWCAAAACCVLAVSFGVPAAAQVPAFYEALYTVSPSAAQFFKPVQLSCEDNGIRMEVTSAYIHENTAEIYVSLQDLEGSRIDGTADLFDSYRIHTPFNCTSNCQLSDYDSDTHTATFLITISQWDNQDIIGKKMTFSVGEILCNKKSFEGVLNDVDLNIIKPSTSTQTVEIRGYSGDAAAVNLSQNGEAQVLKSADNLCTPTEGVTLTGLGYIDGSLHVQVYYQNVLKTDNHGEISLCAKETGENHPCTAAVSFFDDVKEGSYEDYIFEGITPEFLGNYELYGDFVTSSGSLEGNWSVTLPLEERKAE